MGVKDDLIDAEDLLDVFQAHAWDPEPAAFFRKRGLSHGTVSRFGLGYTSTWGDTANGDYRQCLVIPYEDGLGNLRMLKYRPLRESKDKYLSGGKHHLFAVRALDNDTVVVTEGEIDAMILWQIGLKAVGIPGAQSFKPQWRHLFRPPHVRRTIICLDPDVAGMTAVRKVYDLLSDVTDVEVVTLPEGMDVNDTFLRYGADKLLEVLA